MKIIHLLVLALFASTGMPTMYAAMQLEEKNVASIDYLISIQMPKVSVLRNKFRSNGLESFCDVTGVVTMLADQNITIADLLIIRFDALNQYRLYLGKERQQDASMIIRVFDSAIHQILASNPEAQRAYKDVLVAMKAEAQSKII